MSDNRSRGVEFGDLADDLESENYPLSKSKLLDRYGDREVEYADGSATLDELLVEEGDREFDAADSVEETVLNMVGSEAVGRQRYSDRGAGTAEQNGDDDASF